ncbi:Ubiquilin, partial [Cynara cardunculus var. scolymus]
MVVRFKPDRSKVHSFESSVESFKSVFAQNCDIPAEQPRLIYKGRIHKDDQTVKSYGVEAEHTIHLVRGFVPAASINSAEDNDKDAYKDEDDSGFMILSSASGWGYLNDSAVVKATCDKERNPHLQEIIEFPSVI